MGELLDRATMKHSIIALVLILVPRPVSACTGGCVDLGRMPVELIGKHQTGVHLRTTPETPNIVKDASVEASNMPQTNANQFERFSYATKVYKSVVVPRPLVRLTRCFGDNL